MAGDVDAHVVCIRGAMKTGGLSEPGSMRTSNQSLPAGGCRHEKSMARFKDIHEATVALKPHELGGRKATDDETR